MHLKRCIALAIASQFGLIVSVGIANAQAAVESHSIASGDLGRALSQLSAQDHLRIVYAPELVMGKTTSGLSGSYTPSESLQRILAGTGLVVESGSDSTFVLKKGPAPASPSSASTSLRNEPPRKEAMNLAAVTVTGSLRNESAARFVGSDTPLTGATLDQIGATSMQDYLGTVPGVSFAQVGGAGLSNVTIRGVGTTTGIDQGQQTTGIFIDGIPLTEAYFNLATPDIDTFDVDRVEVLRGPQGTTFGTGSMGGAINYIPNKPDMGVFENRVELGVNQLDGNGSMGRVAKAMLNIPVTDNLAVRAVIDDSRTPGYIDNTGTGKNNVNVSDVFGGRLMATWDINDTTSLNWLTLYQKIDDADIYNDVSTVGVMKESSLIAQPLNTSTLINSLKFEHSFDWATLDVMLSSHRKTQNSIIDYTSYDESLFNYEIAPLIAPQVASSTGNTAEARLTSSSDGAWKWLVGVIYDESSIKYLDTTYGNGVAAAIDSIYGEGLGDVLAPADVYYDSRLHVRGQETALYGETSWNFTPQWKLTVGGRFYNSRVTSTTENNGLFNYFDTGTASSTLLGKQSEAGFAPKVSLSDQLSNNTMVYVLASTGFRYGGPNVNPSQGTASTPASFGSDQLFNYELGLRTANEDKTLTASVTAYFINWQRIQLRTYTSTGLAYAVNAGNAHSYGLENSLDWRPNSHFEWQGSLTFGQAKLTTPYAQSDTQVAPAGTLLPGLSKWSASSMVSYNFGGEYHPFVTATYQYRSKATVDLFDIGPKMGNYSLFGLRGGFTAGNATYTAYVSNIGNTKGLSNITTYLSPALQRTYVQPRTVGVLADFSF